MEKHSKCRALTAGVIHTCVCIGSSLSYYFIYSSCWTTHLDFLVTHSCQLLYNSSQSVHYDLKGSCLGAPESLIPVKGVTACVTACGSGPGYISDYLRQ